MKKIILLLFVALLGKAQVIQLNNWQNAGNSWGINTSFLGTTDNRSLRFKTNNILAFSVDSNKICRTFSTTATSAINGSFWYGGGLSSGNGFNLYTDDVANGGDAFTIRNSSNSLNFYQDHSGTNEWYTANGNKLIWSADGGTTQGYVINAKNHLWAVKTQTGTAAIPYQWSSVSSTTLTAGTESFTHNYQGFNYQWGDATLVKQRFFIIQQPAISFTAAAACTELVNIFIYGPPKTGANGTTTNASALMISGITGTAAINNGGGAVTNGYGLSCYAPQGATNNYSARFMGGSVGIGTVSPIATLHVVGTGNISSSLTTNGIANTGTITSTSSILSSGITQGIGYAVGSGSTVTQATNRTTGVTINSITGAITLVSAAGLATYQSFVVTNSAIAATDIPRVVQKSGTDLYIILVTAVSAGSFKISFATTGGTTTEQPVFNFEIIKGQTN